MSDQTGQGGFDLLAYTQGRKSMYKTPERFAREMNCVRYERGPKGPRFFFLTELDAEWFIELLRTVGLNGSTRREPKYDVWNWFNVRLIIPAGFKPLRQE